MNHIASYWVTLNIEFGLLSYKGGVRSKYKIVALVDNLDRHLLQRGVTCTGLNQDRTQYPYRVQPGQTRPGHGHNPDIHNLDRVCPSTTKLFKISWYSQ